MKIIYIILSGLVVCGFSLDYYVSTAGSDSNPGSQTLPFASIQHAIDVSPARPTTTVHLDGSVWNEEPYINGKNIFLIGDYLGPNGSGGRDSTVINAVIHSWSYQNPDYELKVGSLSAEGIDYQPDQCTYSNFEINNCTMSGPDCYGIHCREGHFSIANCLVANGDIGASGYGVVSNCEAYDGGNHGILINGTIDGDVIVENNVLYGHNGCGIYVTSPNNAVVSGNITHHNHWTGIMFYGFGIVNNNICYRNRYEGIKLVTQEYKYAGNNSCSGNGSYGIYWSGSLVRCENNFLGNDGIYGGNVGAGICCRYCSGTTIIKNNIINDNRGDGIHFESASPQVYGNTIENNQGCGVKLLDGHCNPDLGGGSLSSPGDNTIKGNVRYDLYYPMRGNNIYVKYNHWDEITEAQMASGQQKSTNIVSFYDVFDYWQPGDPLSGAFIWQSDFPKNGLLELTACKTNHVQPSSLGMIKANYR